MASGFELNRQLGANSGLVNTIMKAPAASGGLADSRTGLIFFVTSPGDNCRGQYHFGMGPQLAVYLEATLADVHSRISSTCNAPREELSKYAAMIAHDRQSPKHHH